MSLDLGSIVVAFKEETVPGVTESGAGATGLELTAAPGFAPQIADIKTELLNPSRMSGRGRQGSRFYNYAGTTELQVQSHNDILEASVGGTWSAAVTLTEADLTSVTITVGVDTALIVFGGGNTKTGAALVRAGMTAKFAGLSVPANNGLSFPILDISSNGREWTIPKDILVANASDNAFSVIVAKAVYTAPTYLKRSFTWEHYLGDIDRSLVGTRFRFSEFGIKIAQNKMIQMNVGLGGTKLQLLQSVASPNFTSPVFGENESLVLLDGAVYFNGIRRVNISTMDVSLKASITGLEQATTRDSPDAFLGQFNFEGNYTGSVEDGADYDAFDAEDRVSAYFHFAEQHATNKFAARYVGMYIPNMAFGGWNVPAAGEGPAIQTVPMKGGKDKRGATLGFAPTTVLFSTSD